MARVAPWYRCRCTRVSVSRDSARQPVKLLSRNGSDRMCVGPRQYRNVQDWHTGSAANWGFLGSLRHSAEVAVSCREKFIFGQFGGSAVPVTRRPFLVESHNPEVASKGAHVRQ
jgi:hypothetical protein